MARHRVFVTGGTGYIGSRLIPVLQRHGCEVFALAREQSRQKLPDGCAGIIGDALDGNSYREAAVGANTFIQLAGVSHPSPAKARDFVEVDLRSGLEAVRVARETNVEHFVYVSVAHPAPVMRAYTNVRAQCEDAIFSSGLNCTIVRPWYVLGPGHRWAYALLPFYRLAETLPQTRDTARRLGLITLQDMVNTLAAVVANPAQGIRVIEVPEIRQLGRQAEPQLNHN
jgi:uncharacterized protein YbjT (DUF2867 family)